MDWKPRQTNKAHSHQASTETQEDKTPTENHQSASSVGLIPTSLQNYMSFFLMSKPLVNLLQLCPLVF